MTDTNETTDDTATDQEPATAWIGHDDDGDEPYPYWLTPSGHGTRRTEIQHQHEGASAATIAAINDRDVDVSRGTLDAEQYLETVALIDAIWGYARPPAGHPDDTHPLDALRALRAVDRALTNLANHPLYDDSHATYTPLATARSHVRDARVEVRDVLELADIAVPDRTRDRDYD